MLRGTMDRLRSAFGNVLWFDVDTTNVLATTFDITTTATTPIAVGINSGQHDPADVSQSALSHSRKAPSPSGVVHTNYLASPFTPTVSANGKPPLTPFDTCTVVFPYALPYASEKHPLVELSPPSTTTKTKPDDDYVEPSCFTVSLYSAFAIGFICVFLFVVRGYVKYLLISLQQTNLYVSFLVFSVLFTIVSFPLTWGYILLNVAAGYLYGVFVGIIVVMLCALCGLSVAHVIIRRFLARCVLARIGSTSVRALIRIVESNRGVRIIVLSRLTPIPFGLQNALFAVSGVSTPRYIAASIVGMFPTQGMHAYIGSTLRSMEEVISDSSGSGSYTAYAIFSAQLLVAIALLVYVIRRAKYELSRTVSDFDSSSSSSAASSLLSLEGDTDSDDASAANGRLGAKNGFGDAVV